MQIEERVRVCLGRRRIYMAGILEEPDRLFDAPLLARGVHC